MTSCSKLLSAILCSTDRSVQTKELLVMSVSRLRTRSYEIFVRCVRPISSYYIQTTNKTRMLNIDVKGGKYERGCGSSPVVLLHAYLNIAVCLPYIAMHAQFPAQRSSVSAEATKIQQRCLCLLGGQSQPTKWQKEGALHRGIEPRSPALDKRKLS